MECIRLAMTMAGSCKEYPLRLVQVDIATVTMAVIRHPALGAVLAVMAIPGTAAIQPRQTTTAAVTIMALHPPFMVAAAAIDLCIQPAAADDDSTSKRAPWHHSPCGSQPQSLHQNESRPKFHTGLYGTTSDMSQTFDRTASPGLLCIAMPGCFAFLLAG